MASRKPIKRPKNSDSGSPGGSDRQVTHDRNQTTFRADGTPVYPEPQFIGDMPSQLAAASDFENKKGKVAKGAATHTDWGRNVATDGLRFRGMESVYVNPSFVKKGNYFRNDADSAYRQKANKTNKDSIVTDHEIVNTMYKGVQQGAAILSQYFGKPFTVLSKADSDLSRNISNPKKSLEVDVGSGIQDGEIGNAFPGIDTPGSRDRYSSPDMNKVRMNLNPTYNYPASEWAKVFIHEFGHNLGAAHNYPLASQNSVMSGGVDKPTLLPADINRLRDNMGYTSTPQAIKQRVDRLERADIDRKTARNLDKKNSKKRR